MIRRAATILGLTGVLVALVAAGALPVLRGTPAGAAVKGCGPVWGGTPVAATPAPAASPVASPATRAVRPVYTTGPITIRITDDGFVPDLVLSAVGHDLQVTVVNTGSRPHNFCIPALEVDLDLEPGASTTIELNGLPIEDYEFVSDLPGDEHFRGLLTIFI